MAQSRSHPNCSLLQNALKDSRSGLVAAAVFSVVANLLLLTGPIFMLQIYDRVLTSRSVPTLLALVILTAVLYTFFGVLDYLRMRLMGRVSNLLDHHSKDAAFDYYSTAPLKGGSERLSINPVQDLKVVRRFLANPGAMALFDMPWMPIYLLFIFMLHPMIGWFGVIGGLLLIAIAMLNEFGTKRGYADALNATNREQHLIHATRRNAETVAAMGMTATLRTLWNGHHEESVNAGQRAAAAANFYGSMTKTLRMAIQSLMLGLGAYLAIKQEISPGSIIAASIIFARALAPVETTISQWRAISETRFALQRLRKALTGEGNPRSMAGDLATPTKTLAVNDLAIAAPGATTALITSVTFDLSAGDGLGILGPSGSGKSTIAKALVGAWQSGRGSIRLDGAELNQWSPETLGSHIGYLPQEIELFDGTVAENIARFRPNINLEEVIEAAGLAGAHEMIVGLPKGYETKLGAGGIRLSGGQQQRIALARAVFGNPFLLVLDEPNSNLDPAGDKALANAVQALRKNGSIVILITHRPNAIDGLNKLLLMENGSPRAFGDKKKVLSYLTETATQRVDKVLKVVK